MTMKWDIVTREHLVLACESLKADRMPTAALRSLVVVFQGQELPAKKVVKIAYCLASGDLPRDLRTNDYLRMIPR